MIELKIPNDPGVMLASALYLKNEAQKLLGTQPSESDDAKAEAVEAARTPEQPPPAESLMEQPIPTPSAPSGEELFGAGHPAVPPVPEHEIIVTPTAPATDDKFAGVDADGLPWDERIHSRAEEPKKADGRWKRRRGVPDATVAAVEAELRGGPTAPAPDVPTPTPPAPPTPTPPAAATVTLPELMAKITSSGKNFADVMDVLKKHGLNSPTELTGDNVQLIPAIHDELFGAQ